MECYVNDSISKSSAGEYLQLKIITTKGDSYEGREVLWEIFSSQAPGPPRRCDPPVGCIAIVQGAGTPPSRLPSDRSLRAEHGSNTAGLPAGLTVTQIKLLESPFLVIGLDLRWFDLIS